MRISLSLSLTQINQQLGGGVISPWILATGFWEDTGVWEDSNVWED